MAKDYRKKTTGRNNKTSKPYAWIALAFLSGYVCTSLVDISAINGWIKANFLTKEVVGGSQLAKIQTNPTPKPKFEFYTLLTSENAGATEDSRVAKNVMNVETTTANAVTTLAASTKVASSVNLSPKSSSQTSEKAKDETTIAVKQTAETLVNTKESYLVQVAAFKTKPEAERMKATLILKGFNVNIATISQNNINWYRVIIGPFPNKLLAQKAQITVARSEHVMGMIRKLQS